MLSFDLRSVRGDFKLQAQAEVCTSSAIAILGRNGSGKTSLLRAIAGLDPAKGTIYVNEATWIDSASKVFLPTRKRKLGYVSQAPKLFPYMTVSQNLQFALQLTTKQTIQHASQVLSDVIQQTELESLLRRKPSTLSGGETSRVALARALISDPDILLLDEPLATIDLDRKRDLLPFLDGILADRPITMLYVTHDLTEVARLCTHALVLRNGRVVTHGRVDSVLHSISEVDMHAHTTRGSIINTKYIHYDDDLYLAIFEINDQHLFIPMATPPNFCGVVPIRVQERDVAIATSKPKNTSIRNTLKCRILNIERPPNNPFASILLVCGTEKFRAKITRASLEELSLKEDSEVFALIKSATLEA